jgi:hypothetical protein
VSRGFDRSCYQVIDELLRQTQLTPHRRSGILQSQSCKESIPPFHDKKSTRRLAKGSDGVAAWMLA